jgi:anti-sigma B factor antagonist
VSTVELLSTASETHDGWTVVVARGPLDVATAPRLQQVLAEAQVADGARVAVEVSGVEFVDAIGVGVLVGAHVRARLTGGAFVLVAPTERLRDLLDRTDLDSVLTLVPTEDDLGPATP